MGEERDRFKERRRTQNLELYYVRIEILGNSLFLQLSLLSFIDIHIKTIKRERGRETESGGGGCCWWREATKSTICTESLSVCPPQEKKSNMFTHVHHRKKNMYRDSVCASTTGKKVVKFCHASTPGKKE